jgi:hypothetical protein
MKLASTHMLLVIAHPCRNREKGEEERKERTGREDARG